MDPIPKVVVDFIAAYNALDVDGMARCVTDDVHFVKQSGGEVGAETSGVAAFRALAEQGAAAFTRRRQTVMNCIADPRHATLRIDYRATVAIDLPNGWRAGQEVRLDGISLFTLRNGAISELIDLS